MCVLQFLLCVCLCMIIWIKTCFLSIFLKTTQSCTQIGMVPLQWYVVFLHNARRCAKGKDWLAPSTDVAVNKKKIEKSRGYLLIIVRGPIFWVWFKFFSVDIFEEWHHMYYACFWKPLILYLSFLCNSRLLQVLI